MHRYITYNGPMPTSAAQQKVATGTTIKTMLQIATPSTRMMQLISWGFSFDNQPSGSGTTVELLQGDVADTVTAHVASGIVALDPNAPASLVTLGIAATGYTASAQGAMTAVRMLDSQALGQSAGENELNYSYQFMPDERPLIAVSRFVKVRITSGSNINMQCWVCWDE